LLVSSLTKCNFLSPQIYAKIS